MRSTGGGGGGAEAGGLARWSLIVLAVLGLLAALYVARVIVIPLAGALLLTLLFKPLVRWLARRRINATVSAGFIVVGLTVVLIGGALSVIQPLANWLEDAPEHIERIEQRLEGLRGPFEQLTAATQTLERVTDASGEYVQRVEVTTQDLAGTLLDRGLAISVGLLVMLVVTFFLLRDWDRFLGSVLTAMPSWQAKMHTIEAFRELEADVSRFLVLRTLINVGLGVVSWGIFHLMGLPNAGLWAVAVALLNYIPYLGPTVMVAILLVVGLIEFETLGRALAPALLFTGVNFVEGFIVTPVMFGRRMGLNPVVILVGLLAWGALWGVPGALMAVPLLVCLRIACDHIEGLRTLGLFLSAGDPAAGGRRGAMRAPVPSTLAAPPREPDDEAVAESR